MGPELRSGASPIRSGGLPHIKQLVRVVTSRAYRGIDIDYENLALTTDLVLAKKVQRMPGVYDYTAKKAPLGKVELGVPTYGRDWSSGTAATLTGQQAINLARAHGVTLAAGRSGTGQAPAGSIAPWRTRLHQVALERAPIGGLWGHSAAVYVCGTSRSTIEGLAKIRR